MKRPILIALIGYIIGIIWELYLKISIAPFVIPIIIFMVIKGIMHHTSIIKNIKCNGILLCFRKISINVFILILLSMLISNSLTIYLDRKYERIYNTSTEEQLYIGTVISDRKEGDYKSSYTIKIQNINAEYKDIRLILNIPNRYNIKLEYGDKIEFKGTYSAPEVQRNYKGFDYSKYLKTLEIYGIVTYSTDIKVIEKRNISNIKIAMYEVKENIKNNINKLLEKKEANTLIGILLGDTQNIDEEIKEEFRNSGIYHILAVSGAHMSYIILGITYVLNKINISKRKKVIINILGIIFFTMITNSSVSVTRAAIMGIITLGANIFYRKKDLTNSICFSMILILINNPYSINSISFQLSYGGVIGIIALKNAYTQLLRKIIKPKEEGILERVSISIKLEVISTILSAQTMIIPIMILNFHTVSLTFLFANILVSYLIGIIIILGFIFAFVSLISLEISSFIAIFLSILLKILIFIARFFGNIPLSKIYVTTPSIISIILYYITIFWNTIICRGTLQCAHEQINKIRKLLIILLIITLIFNNINISRNLKIHFIDVGQGDACLIITPNNKKVLIDGGGSKFSSDNYEVGEDTLLPYLLDRGVNSIDYIMISHFDADHCASLVAVLNAIKVKNIIISKQAESVYNYERIMEIVINKKINVMVVKRGDIINVDKYVEIKIIYPESKLYFDDINSNSIVAKLTYNNFTMLFTGDIEKEAEERILNIAKEELKSTILKVAHHGSKTSSTKEFLEAIKPSIAIIGVGKNNKFGHPNESVINRLKNREVKIYRTDENGEITIRINKEGRIWIKRILQNETKM